MQDPVEGRVTSGPRDWEENEGTINQVLTGDQRSYVLCRCNTKVGDRMKDSKYLVGHLTEGEVVLS
jgi:hypothetical protein